MIHDRDRGVRADRCFAMRGHAKLPPPTLTLSRQSTERSFTVATPGFTPGAPTLTLDVP